MDGDYDPDRENENTALDQALDSDDDATTPGAPGTPAAESTPYRPGATSTPYHPGEEHEMTHLPQEQSGVVPAPGEPAWNLLTFIYPDANATDLEAFMDPTTQRLKVKMAGAGKKAYYLYRISRQTGQERLNPDLTQEILRALGKSAVDQARSLQQERDTNSQEIRSKTQTKQQLEEAAQNAQTLRQEMDALRNHSRQLDAEIRELEDRTGPLDEDAIQKLKDEKKQLEAEHQRKRGQYDRASADTKRALELQVEINNLKLANRDIDKQINKLGIKAVKPLNELEQEKAELEKRLAENKRVLEDENASPSDIEAAKTQVEQDERALERVNADMEREEQKLPLRERVKNSSRSTAGACRLLSWPLALFSALLPLLRQTGLKPAQRL